MGGDPLKPRSVKEPTDFWELFGVKSLPTVESLLAGAAMSPPQPLTSPSTLSILQFLYVFARTWPGFLTSPPRLPLLLHLIGVLAQTLAPQVTALDPRRAARPTHTH